MVVLHITNRHLPPAYKGPKKSLIRCQNLDHQSLGKSYNPIYVFCTNIMEQALYIIPMPYSHYSLFRPEKRKVIRSVRVENWKAKNTSNLNVETEKQHSFNHFNFNLAHLQIHFSYYCTRNQSHCLINLEGTLCLEKNWNLNSRLHHT